MEAASVEGEAAIERQSEALTRILCALAAMAGLLWAARFGLPRDVYRIVLGPLRAAEAAALRLPDIGSAPGPTGHDPAAERLLRRRFAVLAKTIGELIRRLLAPAPRPVLKPAGPTGRSPVCRRSVAGHATAYVDTS